MIHIVTDQNRSRYALWLDEMFAQRKRVFVDEMGWALNHVNGREMDAFDTPNAIYLLHVDEQEGVLRASARLLPSVKPHLLGEVFAELCTNGVPWGHAVWEASRFCPAPLTPKGEARRHLLSEIIAAIIETGVLFNFEQVTFVASAALAPIAKAVGWSVVELGPRIRHGRDRIQALIADIDSKALKEVRTRNGLIAPQICLAPAECDPDLHSALRQVGAAP